MARYLSFSSPERATKWMSDARSIATSAPADADEKDLLQLRRSIVFHYGSQKRGAEQISFLREWIAAAERGDDPYLAALEPLQMLVDTLMVESDATALKATADHLRDTWMRRPQSCVFLRDDHTDKRREAAVGFGLLRAYQVYALRNKQGRTVGPSMRDIVERVRGCYGEEHEYSLLAQRFQNDTTAGRPTNP